MAIVLAVAVRTCFFKQQEQEVAQIKELGAGPDLDRQVDGDDFA